MGVRITKYGLKWIYGRKVSSANNVRFCARAHFLGIDSHSLKRTGFFAQTHTSYQFLLMQNCGIMESCFIGVIETEKQQFNMAYLSNIELHNLGDMSGLLIILIDWTMPVWGDFFGWIRTGGTSFLLEA